MDLTTLERNLRKAERNVERCKELASKQEELIARLDRMGQDQSLAKEALEILRRSQSSYEAERDRYANLLSEAKKR